MKEGWKKVKFGEVCCYHKENGVHKGLQYVGLEHIESGTGRLTGSGFSDTVLSNTFKFSKGDVLYGRLRPYLKKVFVADFEGCCSTEIFPIQSELINPNFLKYWFLTDSITQKINGTSAGCRMPRGNMNEVLNFSFQYPPKNEQQRIVDYLDKTFAEIDALKAKVAEEVANAKAMFDAALREEMTPKEGWEEKTLPEISENLDNRRKPVTKGKREEGIYPYYGASGIVDYVGGFLYDEDILLISEDGANLLARSTPIAFSVRGKVWVNNHAHVLKFPTLTQQYFVEYYFASINISEYVTGAAQPKLSQKNLNIIPIPVPPLVDQQHIVAHLDSLRSLLSELEQKYTKIATECDALKQAILRETFE